MLVAKIMREFIFLTTFIFAFSFGLSLKPISKAVKVGSLTLSPIGVGTWSWGNRFLWQYSRDDDVELQMTYDYLVSKGINWFDTADSYGTGDLKGQSEKLLGDFDASYKSTKGKNKRVVFATKLAPYPSRISQSSMYEAGLESIVRLKRPIDIIQLHWRPFWVLPPLNDFFEAQYLNAFQNVRQIYY